MYYSEDARLHLQYMTEEQQLEYRPWIEWITKHDGETESTGVSVSSICATDLGIDLDGEL